MKEILQKPAESYRPRGRLDPAGFERHINFQTYAPPADLALFIEHFWVVSWNNAGAAYDSSEVMHRPYVDVFFSAEYSGIQGTFRRTRTYTAAGKGRIIGIRFRPGAFHAFWSETLAELQDRVIDVQKVFPQAADGRYIKRLLALDDTAAVQQLVGLLRSAQPKLDTNIELINRIIAAVEKDEDLLTVSLVAKASGRSERWLQQLFQDYIGVGLKWLLQRQKLLLAAERIRMTDQPDWAALAYDLGYSSQQHFITDFKQTLGKTPRQYKKGLTTVR